MKSRLLAAVVTLTVTAMTGMALTASVDAQGNGTTLFDGRNLDRFNIVGNANWKLVDGAVEANMGAGYLVTKESYGDFALRVEFWVTDDANSGVFIRCSDPKEITAMNSYEVNIFDKRPDQTYRTGAIVNIAKPSAVVNTGGKWSTMEITARGPRMTVAIDGQMLVDVQDMTHARGPIALQFGTGTVKFRKVDIR